MIGLFAVLAAFAFGPGAPEPLQADIAWIVSGEFCEPETVLPLPDDSLLVSNVCGFRESGSGFLSLLNGEGEVLAWRIVEGLDAPLGMALHEGRLYVVDSNRLKVFAWPGFGLLDTIALETSVANDVAVAPDGSIYVTDTAKHQVVQVLPDGTAPVLTGEARFGGANGIAVHEGHVYVGGERLWRVDPENLAVETIGPEWLADIDGIEFEADGTLQATPVGGPLVRYRTDGFVEILAGEGVGSANHGYSAALGLVLIPTGFDNSVIAIRLESP